MQHISIYDLSVSHLVRCLSLLPRVSGILLYWIEQGQFAVIIKPLINESRLDSFINGYCFDVFMGLFGSETKGKEGGGI